MSLTFEWKANTRSLSSARDLYRHSIATMVETSLVERMVHIELVLAAIPPFENNVPRDYDVVVAKVQKRLVTN